ncbi:hypothetical protein LSTR_LSTR011457 [Laodelphax striatellus]|uniref:Uncharacterized protein n=1 Tax=Laodelphax striatellus TaxID=195883 RepID=A0A482WI09_LAOST|nr:hypothetical protein LSTR_LSTR011457 [Laodelphax striatellus]
MAESTITNDDALNVDVEKIQVTRGIGGEEATNMVAQGDNRCKLCVTVEVQHNQIPSTEPVCKVGIIEDHDDPRAENLETEFFSAAEIQSSTLNTATESQSDFKIQHKMLELDSEDGSSKVGESVWEDVKLNNDDGIQLETSIQVEADYSDLTISESPNHFASFRMIFPYFIRVLHVFNSLMINSTPAKKLTAEDSDEASTSDINGQCSLDVGRGDPISCDVFQACSSSGEENLTTPGHENENQCPYAVPEPEHDSPRLTHDRTIDLLSLIVAGEIVAIILCMITFFYHTLQMNDY